MPAHDEGTLARLRSLRLEGDNLRLELRDEEPTPDLAEAEALLRHAAK